MHMFFAFMMMCFCALVLMIMICRQNHNSFHGGKKIIEMISNFHGLQTEKNERL